MLEKPSHIVVPFVCAQNGIKLSALKQYLLRFWFNGTFYIFDSVVEPAQLSVENNAARLLISDVRVNFNEIDWCGFKCPSCGFGFASMCRNHLLFLCAHELGSGQGDLWVPCEETRQRPGGPTDVDVGAKISRRSKAERMYRDLS